MKNHNIEEENTIDNEEKEIMEFAGGAYNFELMDVKGDTFKLSKLSGQKVYIKFWTTWCSMCLSGLSEFIELDKMYMENDDVVILTVIVPSTSNEMSSEKFIQWYTSQKLEFNVLLDNGGLAISQFGIRSFPTSVFIDSNGDVYDMKIGHIYNEDINEILNKM